MNTASHETKNTTPSATGLISQKASAVWLGVSYSHLRRLDKTGQGPARIKLGNRILYSIQDLQAFVDQHREQSTAATQ